MSGRIKKWHPASCMTTPGVVMIRPDLLTEPRIEAHRGGDSSRSSLPCAYGVMSMELPRRSSDRQSCFPLASTNCRSMDIEPAVAVVVQLVRLAPRESPRASPSAEARRNRPKRSATATGHPNCCLRHSRLTWSGMTSTILIHDCRRPRRARPATRQQGQSLVSLERRFANRLSRRKRKTLPPTLEQMYYSAITPRVARTEHASRTTVGPAHPLPWALPTRPRPWERGRQTKPR
jgi:hypothetical protein